MPLFSLNYFANSLLASNTNLKVSNLEITTITCLSRSPLPTDFEENNFFIQIRVIVGVGECRNADAHSLFVRLITWFC